MPSAQVCEQHHVEMIPGEVIMIGPRRCVAPSTCPECEVTARAKAQAEAAQAEADLFYKRQLGAKVPRRYQPACLTGIIADTRDQENIRQAVTRFATSFGTDPTGLAMIGTLGSGKTYCACAVINSFLKAKRSATYHTVLGLIRQLRSRWGSREETEEQLFQKLVQVNLLVLDEVGVQLGSASEQATIGSLLDARYAEQRPTVVIANLTMAELTSALGERIIDRFKQGGKVLVFDWPSRRTMMENESLEDDHASHSTAATHLRVCL